MPLHLAADNGAHAVCKVLIKAGADVNATDKVSYDERVEII